VTGLVAGQMDEMELWGAALFRRHSSQPWGCKRKLYSSASDLSGASAQSGVWEGAGKADEPCWRVCHGLLFCDLLKASVSPVSLRTCSSVGGYSPIFIGDVKLGESLE